MVFVCFDLCFAEGQYKEIHEREFADHLMRPNLTPLRDITDEELAAFQRDGAVCLRGVFDPLWTALVADGIERELNQPGPGFIEQQTPAEPGRFVTDYCPSQQVPELREFVLRSPAARTAARIMASHSAGFLMDVLWIKEAGTAKPTRWHHDQPYFTVDGDKMCSIWFPVDPVPREMSLQLIRGSHLWQRWFTPTLTSHQQPLYSSNDDGERRYESMPDFDAELDSHELLAWSTEPGDCVAFHALTVHMAPGNIQLSERRRVLSTVWFGDGATYARRPSSPRPHFAGHGLKPGDALESEYFPRLWPRPRDDSRLGAVRYDPNGPLHFTL